MLFDKKKNSANLYFDDFEYNSWCIIFIFVQMEQVNEKEVSEYLQVSVDVLADRDSRVPEHLRPRHGASSSASVAGWLPGERHH